MYKYMYNVIRLFTNPFSKDKIYTVNDASNFWIFLGGAGNENRFIVSNAVILYLKPELSVRM